MPLPMEFNQREAILLSLLCSVGILMTGYLLVLKSQFKAVERSSAAFLEVTGEVKALEAEQMGLKQQVGQGKTQYEENKTALSFTFENKDLESRMKGFMRVLSTLTTQTGNQLITIQPYGGALQDSASKAEKLKEDGEKPSEIPEELQRFQAIKEQDLPLYSTKMELKIRGNFAEIKRFMETLATFKKELVQVESMYLSYEGLGERLMTNFLSQDSGKKSNPARHLNRPLLLVTRLKFYLMEPNEQSFDQAVEELKAQTEAEETSADASKESAT
jgi:hypothetical protein